MERILEPELMTDPAQAHAYADSDFSTPHNAFVAHFQKKFPEFKGLYVADLGCGTADVTIRMAKVYPKTDFVGIDGAEVMLALGNEAVTREGLSHQIALLNKFLPNHGFPTPYFDAVFSNSLLHQLHHPEVLWQSIKELAYPESPVFIMDLIRPENLQQAQELVRLHSQGLSQGNKIDFYNSLLAAFTLEEVDLQLHEAQLSHLNIEKVSDRHMIISGKA